MTDIGHNSNAASEADKVKAFVGRIETLAEERDTFTEDIKSVYSEAKESGLDTKALRALVRIRRQDAAERQAREAAIEKYMNLLGMI